MYSCILYSPFYTNFVKKKNGLGHSELVRDNIANFAIILEVFKKYRKGRQKPGKMNLSNDFSPGQPEPAKTMKVRSCPLYVLCPKQRTR